MRIQVISNLADTHLAQFIGRTAIVIDVVKTSTSIITALEAGAACVIPAETVMDAKNIMKEGDRLAGERFCKKIEGFHYGNSPTELARTTLLNQRMILTTTNGTRAIKRATKASNLLIGALRNARACTELALKSKQDLVILCAGSHDQFTIEDGFCAGLMIDEITKRKGLSNMEMNDLGYAMLSLYKHMELHPNQLKNIGLSSKLLSLYGCPEDISYCLEIDRSSIVPTYVNGIIVTHSNLLPIT